MKYNKRQLQFLHRELLLYLLFLNILHGNSDNFKEWDMLYDIWRKCTVDDSESECLNKLIYLLIQTVSQNYGQTYDERLMQWVF